MLKILKNAFVKENSIRGASLILIITLALSNVLGVIRDHFLASKIPTDRLDIYFASFRLPDLIFNVLILGSIAAAFVPVYSNYLKNKGNEEANKLAQASMTIGISVISVALVLLYILMPYLIVILVPDFSYDKQQETLSMARLLLISPFFFTISYFLGGILNSHKRFLAYSTAPLVYNLSIIVGVLLFAEKYGVKGAIIGVIMGAVLHLLVQLPAAIKVGFNFAFRFDYKEAGVRRVLRLMVPRAIGLGANQILLVAFTAFASTFPGGIAIYNFADNIQTVPTVIFGTALATAVFPTLAGLSAKNKEELNRFGILLQKTFRSILFLLVPATALLILLRAQVIRIILGYGFFGWSDTRTAAAVLGFFALSIIAQGLIPLMARSFYALHDTKTPMFISIIAISVSILTGYFLSEQFENVTAGISVLALSFSLGSWVNFILLWIYLNKKIDIDWGNFGIFILRIIAVTLFMAVVVQATKGFVADMFGIDRVRYLALQIILSSGLGIASYIGLAYLLGFEEVKNGR